MDGALAGIRVLDFTRHMAGPLATVVLADHGADVIKVESLPDGDGSRRAGIAFVEGEGALFLDWNRGKRGIALDMRRPEAREIIDRLVSTVDVVVENYRTGVADQIGIGYERLSAIKPDLVYCSVSAFGSEGPWAGSPGTDPVVQAMSGVMSLTGEPGRDPVLVGVPIADFVAAMVCAQAIMLGLLARQRTGAGQKVEVPMLAALMSSLTTRFATHWATGEEQQRCGSAHSVVVPYQAFRTADGYAVAGAWGEAGWPRLCAALERPELATDPRFADNSARFRNRDQLITILSAIMETRTTAEWEERFRDHKALFGPVLDLDDLQSHPQVEALGVFRTVPHTTLGPVPQIGPPIRLSATPPALTRAAPLLGEHTVEVLREARYGDDEIAALLDSGVARTAAAPGSASGSEAAAVAASTAAQ